METLNQLTQSHLSVLVLDKDSSNPIQRMPIYAEISVIQTTQSLYIISPDEFGSNIDNLIADLVRSSLAEHLDEPSFRSMLPKIKEQLTNLISKLLSEQGNLSNQPDKELRAIIDEAIVKALTKLKLPISEQAVEKSVYSYPLGYLATDHVGYASFDLSKFPENNIFNASENAKREYSIFVYPMGKEGGHLEVLKQARLTKEAVFAKIEIDRPVFDVDLKALNLPSMQKPSLVDWYFSPGSFATKPEFLVGEDGCEQLMPAQLALSQFNFRQVVRLADKPTDPDNWPEEIGDIPADAKYAYVDEYQASWYALGHSLGEIQYSLPLAPGESVKLAVIDWSWDSLTSRDEKTKFTEEVLHQTHRDRTISETVKAAVDEWQRGGNIQAGIAGGSGAAGSAGGKGFSSGNAWSLGGGYSTSSGSRNLAAENVQRLSDSFVQASSAQRELNSTVVIQARQEEKESIQTRTFTNYNHSHTLTILYYEVLRHFKLEVEWIRRRPAILVPVTPIDFSELSNAQLLNYRNRIEDSLLDMRFETAFSIVEELDAEEQFQKQNPPKPSAQPFWVGDLEFTLFEIGVRTADEDLTSQLVMINLITTNGDNVERPLLQAWNKRDLDENLNVGQRFNYKNTWSWFIVRPVAPLKKIKWHELVGFEFVLHANDDWRTSGLAINAFHAGGKIELLPMKEDANYYFANNSSSNTITYIDRPKGNREPSPEPPKKPLQMLSKEKLQQYQALRNHLVENEAYYQRQIYLNNPIEATQVNFDERQWDATDATSFYSQHAEPIPLEAFGNYVAFPLLLEKKFEPKLNLDGQVLERKAERLATLPTRGVFAEGKLGHCNVSEEIDNTRFWKWEEHPIPIQAPDIAPIQAVTPQPQQTNIAAGAFPAALLSIVNPSPAPDPQGLGEALKLMATSNLFRDMSGRTETTDLLKKLSDNSVKFAEIAEKALHPQTSGSAAPSGGTSGGNPSSSSSTSPSNANQGTGNRRLVTPGTPQTIGDVNDLASGIRNQLPPEQANTLVGQLYQNAVYKDGANADGGIIKDPSLISGSLQLTNSPFPPGGQHLCFPVSAFQPSQFASGFGTIAERLIEQDYCDTMRCSPSTTYIDNFNPTEYKDFLVAHNPSLASGPLSVKLSGAFPNVKRPDIMSDDGTRKDYYEIKPLSISGAAAGTLKLTQIILFMNDMSLPYVPGTAYTPSKEIPILTGTMLGCKIGVSLSVERLVPGIITYNICLDGELALLFLKASVAAILAWLAAEILLLLAAPTLILA
jgi:hypothetical protein